MRSWGRIAATVASQVADRPGLWIRGGLAWMVTLGWLALVIGVARPPSVGELTVFGASMATSGAWPWNLAAMVLGVLMLASAAAALAALAEMSLLRGDDLSPADVGRALAVTVACGALVVVAATLLAVGIAAVAVVEFNSPRDDSGPIVRIVLRLLPLVVLAGVVAVTSAALHAAAIRQVARGSRFVPAMRSAPRALVRGGRAALTHLVVSVLLRLAYVALAAILLRVLWAPIESELVRSGISAAASLLLLGFVAIWLCLVLGGGALHAWGSVTWTRILGIAAEAHLPSTPTVETPAQH